MKTRFVAGEKKRTEISLDTHYHYDGNPEKNDLSASQIKASLASFTDINNIARAFLTSDAYESKLNMRSEMDQVVIDMANESSGRYLGVCGVDPFEEGATDVALRCLKSKFMKGIKVHMYYVGCFSTDIDIHNTFIKLLNSIKEYKPFILIHIDDRCENLKELKTFFHITKKYPELLFIIAHSRKAEGLEWIGNQYQNNPNLKQNIYTEISTVESLESIQSIKSIVSAWRKFGLDRVLFGTDNSSPYNPCEGLPIQVCDPKQSFYPSIMSLLSDENLISPIEKNMILKSNGINFLKKINMFSPTN